MKKAAKVFLIIGLILSIIVIIMGIYLGNQKIPMDFFTVTGYQFMGYGIYCLIASIACLSTLGARSKVPAVICGFFYMPVILLASIFIWCIPADEFY